MKRMMIVAYLFGALSLYAQTEQDAAKFAETITQEDLREHLTIVASDAMEGRETGKRGQKMAAAYIKATFEELGLAGPVKSEYGNGHYQRVPLYTSVPGETWVKAGGKTLTNFSELFYLGSTSMDAPENLEVVFAGNGSTAEMAAVGAKGKAVVVMIEGIRTGIQGAREAAIDAGAALLIVAPKMTQEDWDNTVGRYKRWLSGGRLSVEKPEESDEMGLFVAGPEALAAITSSSMEKLNAASEQFANGKKNAFKKIKDSELSFYAKQKVEVVNTENVLGYLEGSDKKEELLVITAHYDHEGKRNGQIYNGADDDGSGTVSVLELAEAFVEAKKQGKGPRRSILFMTVTGEEKGLLGSDYYTRNPVFPLENTVANLNIDMVGRIDPDHEGKGDYVYLVGSDRLSSELHEISELANEKFTNMDLDYTYNDENHPDRIYYRSDHWNFAKNNVPIIFYFNGTHEDYHQPTDTVDKIEFPALQKRAQLVFYTAWALANREDRIVVDKIESTSVETK